MEQNIESNFAISLISRKQDHFSSLCYWIQAAKYRILLHWTQRAVSTETEIEIERDGVYVHIARITGIVQMCGMQSLLCL